MQRSEAQALLVSLTKSASLLRHMRTVELVMEAYAEKLGENKEEWAVAGLLHDADYEAFPDKHPGVIVEKLRGLGEEKIAHAISAHYTLWNVPYDTLLDKALLARRTCSTSATGRRSSAPSSTTMSAWLLGPTGPWPR